jgi:epimerase transport system membrane fusion protein
VSEDSQELVTPENDTGTGVVKHVEGTVVSAGRRFMSEEDLESPKRIGKVITTVVFGVFGLWASLYPIDGAIHAGGQVVVETYRKPIQHLEGGIVKEVLVRDGSVVAEGEPLIIMDNTQSLSQLEILRVQELATLALEARLIAERDALDAVQYPAALTTSTSASATIEMSAQTQIFNARKTYLRGETEVLQQRVEQLMTRAEGLEALKASKLELVESFGAEISDFKALLAEGFADKLRLRELERNHSAITGEIADLTANIASTQVQAGEARLQILQLRNQGLTEIVNLLSEAQTKLKDMQERIIALEDIVRRTEIRSPASGIINNLQVHSPAAVIPPGAIIAEVVPQSDNLLVEARISPIDIDRVFVGQPASIRMSALNARRVPTLDGKVLTVSADAVPDRATNTSFYLARLQLDPDSFEKLYGASLVPGMPAEVFISTGSRTFFQYVLKPLTDSMARAFRED